METRTAAVAVEEVGIDPQGVQVVPAAVLTVTLQALVIRGLQTPAAVEAVP